MNERITAGAAAIQGSLILATLLARYYARPPRQRGRHRKENPR